MITVSQIRDGRSYMRRHLSANDYYSENEKVVGQWHGKAARILGLEGETVTESAFEALRSNRHPGTGGKLTPRRPKVAFHDFVISAPKSVSIAAMVGGDHRVLEAFDRCVLRAFERLETFAGVRNRAGEAYSTEDIRQTSNAVAAIFRHDTSRLLDPQLHTHLVFANATWDMHSQRWLALQPKPMAEESKSWIRGELFRDLAGECQQLGYTIERDGESFRLGGIDSSIEHSFSKRAVQRERFESRYRQLFGQAPGKKRVEQFIKEGRAAATQRFRDEYQVRFGTPPSDQEVSGFVRDWRSTKMAQTSREEVRARQQGQISVTQAEAIQTTVTQALEKVDARARSKSFPPAEEPKETLIPDWNFDTVNHDARERSGSRRSIRNGRRIQSGKPTPPQRRLAGIKKGKAVMAALRGHPARLMAWRVQQLAKQRHAAERRHR